MLSQQLCSQRETVQFSFLPKISFDFPLPHAILSLVDNFIWSTGACSRFSSFGAPCFTFARP